MNDRRHICAPRWRWRGAGLGETGPTRRSAASSSSDGRVVGRAVDRHRRPAACRSRWRWRWPASRRAAPPPMSRWSLLPFHGRTPPCTDALIDAGVARVVIGATRSAIRGSTARALPACARPGSTSTTGVLRAGGGRGHRRLRHAACAQGRPLVTLKLASTLDGRIATQHGESRGSPASRRGARRMRCAAGTMP